MPGRYLIDLAVGDELDPHRYNLLLEAAELNVEATDIYGSGKLKGANFSLVFTRMPMASRCRGACMTLLADDSMSTR